MSIWQTKKRGEMLKESNQADEIFEVNWFFLEKRKVSFKEYWLFCLWIDRDISNEDLEEMIRVCKKENILFLQIETLDYNKLNIIKISKQIKKYKKFKNWYYKKFITPYTALIDLNKTDEEILNLMKPKWRYNIKLASKKWVEVIEVEKNDVNIKIFYDLMLETTSRDSFNWNNIEYYKKFLETLKNSKLLLASINNKVIAWWIFVFDKDISIYYYWASTSDKNFRNLMAPYLLQWEAIKIAKSLWSKLYDFLWVSAHDEINSHLEWVTDFKMRFTKDIRRVSDSYIWVNKKFKFFIIELLRKMK
jgi:lipid II:glycine glycyltransferase (peptidoglycan interpeptide bridge formation enzyme)